MDNNQYWEKRMLEIEQSIFKDTVKMERELDKIYKQQIVEIENEIIGFINRYVTENDTLDYKKVTTELLTGIDMIEYRNKINEMSKIYQATGDEEIMAEMNLLRGRQKVTLWQSLIDSIQMKLGVLSIEESELLQEHLEFAYTYAFEHTAYLLAVNTGVEQYFTMPNQNALKEVIKYPISGEKFSKRIWKNNTALLAKLKEELTRSAIQGKSITKIAKDLKPYLRDSNDKYADYNAKRIARTETAFMLESATVETYKQVDLPKLQILATLDKRTCNHCGKHDLELVDVDKAKSGVNIPPFHPNCRCTTTPYIEGFEGTRTDNSDEGLMYGYNSLGNKVKAGRRKVSSNMSFEEWKRVFVNKELTYEQWLELKK